MSMPADLISYLNDQSGVTTLVGDRIAMVSSPQSDALPRIVIQEVGGDSPHHMTASSGYLISNYQITAYATSTASARAVMEQVRLVLDGFRGDMSGGGGGGGTTIDMCHKQDERDGVDPPVHADGVGTFNCQHDYQIAHAVSVPSFA